jgi:hypothetical protein
MAQSVITGLTGSITLPNSMDQYVASITLSTGADLLDVTHYGGAGWRQRVAGVKDLSGTATAFMTKGAAGTSPLNLSTTPSTMTILFDTGCSVSFEAVIGNTQIVGEYTGLNVVTFNFAKADDVAPTITWVVA